MDALDKAVGDAASTLFTGTPPGKPAAPFVVTYETGTVTAVSAPTCTVEFAADPSQTAVSIAGLSYLLTGRTPVVNDVVLVAQFPHQRLVIAAISH